ncbi:MAG: TraR/DksA family transcriptional regulator [Pirellulales bacterium]|nr:TraR/DksA family transcriptional regulator [Pirellulales bacterium]
MITKDEAEEYRELLQGMLRRLSGVREQLAGEALHPIGGEAAGGISNVPLHLGDLGSQAYEEEMLLGLLENEEQLIAEVNLALDRLSQGVYGQCERCGQEISRARLRALPYVRYCLACAKELEKS